MRASAVMAVAVLLYVLARWSRNEPAITLGTVVGGLFAIAVIAFLDQGSTGEIASGFAWLFFAAAAYNAVPVVAGAARSARGLPPPSTTGGQIARGNLGTA